MCIRDSCRVGARVKDSRAKRQGNGNRAARRCAVAWFIGQSAVMIGLAFLLGLLVGWLLWGQHGRSGASKATVPTVPGTPQLPPAPVVKMPASDEGRQ